MVSRQQSSSSKNRGSSAASKHGWYYGTASLLPLQLPFRSTTREGSDSDKLILTQGQQSSRNLLWKVSGAGLRHKEGFVCSLFRQHQRFVSFFQRHVSCTEGVGSLNIKEGAMAKGFQRFASMLQIIFQNGIGSRWQFHIGRTCSDLDDIQKASLWCPQLSSCAPRTQLVLAVTLEGLSLGYGKIASCLWTTRACWHCR